MKTNKRKYIKKIHSRKHQKKTISNKKGGKNKYISLPNIPLPKLPLPNIPSPINPILNKKITKRGVSWKKGGFKADIVDYLEDRDDDWMITKQ